MLKILIQETVQQFLRFIVANTIEDIRKEFTVLIVY